MRVILLQDVAKVGRKYDVKEVSAGYAANFLFPRKLAAPADKEAESKASKQKAEIEAERKLKDDLLAKNISTLDGAKVTIKSKADEKGHLYAKIHQKEIVKAVKDQLSVDIPEEIISPGDSYKEVGEYDIKITAGENKSKFKLYIEKA